MIKILVNIMAFIDCLKKELNYGYTANGALTHRSTLNAVYDMFATGGAMRNADGDSIIYMFNNAYEEDPVYALKCLFYLRDITEGQGERRFFRICLHWLANNKPNVALNCIPLVQKYGRYDDLYCYVDTPLEKDMFNYMKKIFKLDLQSETPSLLGKWLKSENASSELTKELANKTRIAFGLSHKEYRKCLSVLRKRINVLETLMSSDRWDEIEFDKIPSKAGLIYRNAFACKDITKERYKAFIENKKTKVNAKALYPYDCVHQAIKCKWDSSVERQAIEKYWDNLTDYFNGKSLNALAVVDTSGSMTWGCGGALPIDVAISLGMYFAEKAKGPFAHHYISFSSNPQLIKIKGEDFCDKVTRIYKTNLCANTNIAKTFDLILNTAIDNNCSQEELPEHLIIISDMEFDYMVDDVKSSRVETLLETIKRKWKEAGYDMPKLIFWNVNASTPNIPMEASDKNVTYVSGCSPVLFDAILSEKTGIDLMYEKLDSERYNFI